MSHSFKIAQPLLSFGIYAMINDFVWQHGIYQFFLYPLFVWPISMMKYLCIKVYIVTFLFSLVEIAIRSEVYKYGKTGQKRNVISSHRISCKHSLSEAHTLGNKIYSQ